MMNTTRRVALVSLFYGAFFLTGHAWAGDVKGKVSAQGLKSSENIVVYIDAIPGKKFDVPNQHVLVDQRNMQFVPHLTVILRGTTVDFSNSDAVFHNVFWPSISGKKSLFHNMALVGPGQKKSFKFDEAGSAQLLCNIHPAMVAYVVIVPTSYFAQTDADGNFDLKNVPAGTYTLKTWSEDGKPTTQTITISDATTNVDVVVKK